MKNTAVLVINMQNEHLSPLGIDKNNYVRETLFIQNINVLTNTLREDGAKIIWIESEYDNSTKKENKSVIKERPPEDKYQYAPLNDEYLTRNPARKKYFAAKSFGRKTYTVINQMINKKDIILKKAWYSAFTDSELLDTLKENKITDLIITGLLTNESILATAVDAFFLKFNVFVPKDCTMTLKPKQKTLSLADIKLHYAKIHPSNKILEENKLEPLNSPITGYGANDTALYFNIIPDSIKETAFDDLMKEIEWKHMNQKTGPVPRMISIQGNLEEDKFPLYRHPIDEQPDLIKWTPTVKKIKDLIEEKLDQPINHALVQYYKNGYSFIQQHADKTLDIKKGTNIINVSFGSTRTMRLMNKKDTKPRDIQKIELINGSVLCMGWKTNLKWVHGIRPDKRSDKSKRSDELLHDGGRISLTFRTIATYQHKDGSLSGQGAPKKSSKRNHEEEAVEMLKAFGIENFHSDFDWDKNYGNGFYALNLGRLN